MTITLQEYINTLFAIQCCYANKAKVINDREYLGLSVDCLNEEFQLLYMYYITLYRQASNPANTCLSIEEINCILEEVSVLCNNCNDISKIDSNSSFLTKTISGDIDIDCKTCP